MCLVYFEDKVDLDFASPVYLRQHIFLWISCECISLHFLETAFYLTSLSASHALTFTSAVIKVDSRLGH